MSTDLVLTSPDPRALTHGEQTMDLIRMALQSEGTPQEKSALVKELVSLQQSMVRFDWEKQERQSKIDFDDALNACQSQIGRIAPNQKRTDTSSWWADYAQLDRTLRPIYTAAGFSIAFSEVAPVQAGKVRIQAELSRGGISKHYFSEITPTTTGPKGGAMATATDADAIAQSRAKRYIMLDIFNIAVGIDAQEKQGVPAPSISEKDEAELQSWCEALQQAPGPAQLKGLFADAYKFAGKVGGDPAKKTVREVYEAMKRKMGAQ